MRKRDIVRFKKILEKLEAELERDLDIRRTEAIQQTPDETDMAVRIALDHTEACVSNGKTGKLRDAQAALHRIKNGTFGKCLECDGIIPPKRLKFVPWASLCCRCKEKADAAVPVPARRRKISSSNRKVYGR